MIRQACPLPGSGYKTTKAVDNCFYEFHEISDSVHGTLRIFEVPANEIGWRLELLEPETMPDAMPVRLRELHSHWLEANLGLVVLRGHHFKSKRIDFVIHIGQLADASSSSFCFRVPEWARERSTDRQFNTLQELARQAIFTECLVPTPNDFALTQVKPYLSFRL